RRPPAPQAPQFRHSAAHARGRETTGSAIGARVVSAAGRVVPPSRRCVASDTGERGGGGRPMSALRNPGISDILAATGKAGMQEAVAEKFWTWRRSVLAVGYGLVLLTGLQIVFAADPTGFILVAAAILGVFFLHRTWLGVLVWTYVAISGVVALTSGNDLGLYAVLAGLGLALVALPI